MRSRNSTALLLLCLLGSVSGGCHTQKAWLYSIEAESNLPVLINKAVAVPPFSDQRENANTNMWAMYIIPLMPFGWQDMDAPEGSQMHMTSGLWLWRPNEDLAKAAAEELNASHIFKEVFFTNRASDGDLVLTGTIKSTNYAGKLISYGLSVYGPLLWLVGFPATYTGNVLDVSFSLRDRQTKQVIWENAYSETVSGMSWIYYLRSDFNYSSLYKKIMLQAVKDLRGALARPSG